MRNREYSYLFDILLRNRIHSTCMLLLSKYTFIILTMFLHAQCNSKGEGNHAIFLNLYTYCRCKWLYTQAGHAIATGVNYSV